VNAGRRGRWPVYGHKDITAGINIESPKSFQENDLTKKILDSPLREVHTRIIDMIGKDTWEQEFVMKCLDGFIQCLKVMDSDYETIDLLTHEPRMRLMEILHEEMKRKIG